MEQDNISPEKNGENGFGDMLNSILSNPQMMSMIGEVAQKLKNGEANTEEQKVSEAESAPPPEEATAVPALANSISALAPSLSKSLSGHSKADDKRACLLRALKPYMSEGRCDAIEYIIKISLISDVLKNLS